MMAQKARSQSSVPSIKKQAKSLLVTTKEGSLLWMTKSKDLGKGHWIPTVIALLVPFQMMLHLTKYAGQ